MPAVQSVNDSTCQRCEDLIQSDSRETDSRETTVPVSRLSATDNQQLSMQTTNVLGSEKSDIIHHRGHKSRDCVMTSVGVDWRRLLRSQWREERHNESPANWQYATSCSSISFSNGRNCCIIRITVSCNLHHTTLLTHASLLTRSCQRHIPDTWTVVSMTFSWYADKFNLQQQKCITLACAVKWHSNTQANSHDWISLHANDLRDCWLSLCLPLRHDWISLHANDLRDCWLSLCLPPRHDWISLHANDLRDCWLWLCLPLLHGRDTDEIHYKPSVNMLTRFWFYTRQISACHRNVKLVGSSYITS